MYLLLISSERMQIKCHMTSLLEREWGTLAQSWVPDRRKLESRWRGGKQALPKFRDRKDATIDSLPTLHTAYCGAMFRHDLSLCLEVLPV
jgi:hypothetical protein